MLERILASTIAMATPILFAALGELFVEQSGLLNIGIEGSMLVGAFAGLTAAYSTGSIAAGLVAAVLSALTLNALLALLVVNFAVNQVVAGTALDMLALGLTGVLYRSIFGLTGRALTIRPIANLTLGPFSTIPIIGPAFFHQNAIAYAGFLLVPMSAWLVRRTRFGLRLRAAGERPEAAEALGINVFRQRWTALMIAGALTGIGGAYLTMAYTNTFVEGISAGRGFVALAVVIVGRWNAYGIAAASLFFGAAMALQFGLQAYGLPLPYQFFLALPYALTLIVLAAMGGQAASPSALGQPYVRENA